MSDRISPQDRKLIDAAIKAGRVKKCPPCTFALDPTARLTREQVKRIFFSGAPSSQQVAARRNRVLALVRDGLSNWRISEELGVSPHTVSNDVLFLRDAGHEMPAVGERRAAGRAGSMAAKERRQRVKAAVLRGETHSAIAKAEVVSQKTIELDIRKLKDAGDLPDKRLRPGARG